jgi:hypothetical protein
MREAYSQASPRGIPKDEFLPSLEAPSANFGTAKQAWRMALR